MGTLLFIRLFIVICFVGVIVAINAIEKRDVHHKIIVKTGRKPRSSHHHHHHHHNHKNRGKNNHHHHKHQDDASLEDDLLYTSRENSFEDTSKYQSHRHKSKSRPHHFKPQEPPFQIDFTPLVSAESEDLYSDHRNHHYNKRQSNQHKKRHNHRNHYGETLKPPQIELTTTYPTQLPFLAYFETTHFPSFDGFNSFNQKVIDLNQPPLINPSFIIKPQVNDDAFINSKNQTFGISTPTFKMEKLVADETVAEKLSTKVEEPLTTTVRPSIRSRGKVATRKRPN